MTPPRTPKTRNAFTLLELLIAVAIIAALAAITTLVGSAVLDSGKQRATLGVLQTLDEALAAYKDKNGDNPPALVGIPAERMGSLPAGVSQGDIAYYPAIDGRWEDLNTPQDILVVNSVALFIESVRTVPETQDIINSINPRFLQNYTPYPTSFPQLLTVFDAWGNPIRYVHPKLDGVIQDSDRGLGDNGMFIDIIPDISTDDSIYFIYGSLPDINLIQIQEVRRNFITADELQNFPNIQTDSDGGLTAGNRPYFYSAGPDGNPATIEDNIYLNPVQHADPGVN